jgi:CMP-N-acetylneuraminic acid synthetase
MPKVTVYIPVHNYGRFLPQAIESVAAQKYHDWELIVINDGSTDETREVLARYSAHPQIAVVHQQQRGLPVSNNVALRLARGEYIVRLDADDYLDENMLLVLANILDTHPAVGLVYPDYYRVDERGDILGVERRNKVGSEITVYDMPAHGACTMIRKSCLLELGGYSEDIACQDGFDLWVRFIDRFGIYNVNVPLFYYRQHKHSLTKDQHRILSTRRLIQRRHAQRAQVEEPLRIVGIVPVRAKSHEEAAYALRAIGGRPLVDYTLEAAVMSEALARVVVVTADEEVLAHAGKHAGVTALRRPAALEAPNTPIEPTIRLVLESLAPAQPVDAFMLLYVNSPLRRDHHIRDAIDTMRIFRVDSVISVYENLANHYQHVGAGLRPLFKRRRLRLEKDALWVENGAIYLSRTANLRTEGYLGERIGHSPMLKYESLQIDSEEDFLVVEHLLLRRRAAADMVTHG